MNTIFILCGGKRILESPRGNEHYRLTNWIVRKQYLDIVKIKENVERKKVIENVFGYEPQKPKQLNFVYEFLLKRKGFSF